MVPYIKLEVTSIRWVDLMRERYALGVDWGATKTVALIGTEHGKILGRGRSVSSNYHNVGVEAACVVIREAVTQARRETKIRRSGLETAVVALATGDSPRDRATLLHFIRRIKIARKIKLVHDAVATLQAGTSGKPGIIVISGTGCVAQI